MGEAAVGNVPVRARRIETADDLSHALTECGPAGLVVDCVRRGLSPHFAAAQICGQIGTTCAALLADLPPVRLPRGAEVGTEEIGSWIDVELFGDTGIVLADRVAAAAGDAGGLLVLLPEGPEVLPRGDALTIASMARAVAQAGNPVTLGYPGNVYALPEDLDIPLDLPTDPIHERHAADALPPGPIVPAFADKLARMGLPMPPPLPGPRGVAVFAPADRRGPAPAVPPIVTSYAAHWGWDGLPFLIDTADAGTLAHLAWAALQARDADLATRLGRLAITRPGDTAFARLTLATILIVDQAYEDLAALEAVSRADDLNRAWGQTLAGSARAAASAFDGPAATQTPALALYLQNISALADVRTGDVQAAWDKQRRIEAAVARLDPPSPHLAFINALNMGRLARAGGDRAEARRLIAAAFAHRTGALSEHDDLYREILLADVAPDPDAARAGWRRARRILDGQAHPDAIPARSFRKIVGRAPRPLERRAAAVRAALDARTAGG